MLKQLAAGIFILASASPALAQGVTELQRVGRWQVDYDAEACHLAAQFGEGKDAVIARFTRFSGEDYFDLWLSGSQMRASDMRATVKVGFGIGPENVREAIVGKADKPVLIIASLRFDGFEVPPSKTLPTSRPAAPRVTPEMESRVVSARIKIETRKPIQLMLGNLEKPMKAMRTCIDDLVKQWGYDPVVQNQITERPVPLAEMAKMFSSNDFPDEMLRGGYNGLVQYRLDIDEQGSVTSCHVLYHTEKDDFAKATCDILSRKAKYKPALDPSGKPVKTYTVGKTVWTIAG